MTVVYYIDLKKKSVESLTHMYRNVALLMSD
jgi:hypothetical protein